MPGLIKNSSKDSQLNVKLIGYAVGLLLVIGFAGQYLWKWGGDEAPVAAAAAIVEPTIAPTIETPTVASTPIVLEVVRQIEVTRQFEVEVTREVPFYVNVPIEVTRVVTVEVIPQVATPVPTPNIAAGQVKICASVEGARELYIGGYGVVSGECALFGFGVGQTTIQVQVNK